MDISNQNIQNIFSNGYNIYSSLENIEIIYPSTENPQRVLSINSDATLVNIEHTGPDIKFLEELSQILDQKLDPE